MTSAHDQIPLTPLCQRGARGDFRRVRRIGRRAGRSHGSRKWDFFTSSEDPLRADCASVASPAAPACVHARRGRARRAGPALSRQATIDVGLHFRPHSGVLPAKCWSRRRALPAASGQARPTASGAQLTRCTSPRERFPRDHERQGARLAEAHVEGVNRSTVRRSGRGRGGGRRQRKRADVPGAGARSIVE